MATSRTGTAKWKNLRRRTLHEAKSSGLTNCPLCQCELDYDIGKTPTSAEVDHIHSVARGGQDTSDNVRVICRRCNQKRGAGETAVMGVDAFPLTPGVW